MGKTDTYRKALLSLMFLIMTLLSYRPLQTEVHALYLNATTTNVVIAFLDSWFGLFWALLAVFFLGSALYEIIATMA